VKHFSVLVVGGTGDGCSMRHGMKHKSWLGLVIGGVMGIMLLSTVSVTWAAPQAASYGLSWYTIAGGGASFAAGGTYTLGGTIGQAAAGPLSGGSYALEAGFWAGMDAVVPPEFTDNPLAVGITHVKAVHITELREAIEVLRARYALGAFGWTDASPVAGVTLVKALHVTEMRTALDAVYVAAARTVPSYTHVITAGSTVITAVDIAELRAAILAIW